MHTVLLSLLGLDCLINYTSILNPFVYLYLWIKKLQEWYVNTMLHEYLDNLKWYKQVQKCHSITIRTLYVLLRVKHPHTPLKTNSIPSSISRLHKLKTTQPLVTQADIYTQTPALASVSTPTALCWKLLQWTELSVPCSSQHLPLRGKIRCILPVKRCSAMSFECLSLCRLALTCLLTLKVWELSFVVSSRKDLECSMADKASFH